MKVEAEVGVMLLEAKEHQRLPDNPRSLERSMGQVLPLSLRRKPPCQHLHLGLPASRTLRHTFLLLKLPSQWCLVLVTRETGGLSMSRTPKQAHPGAPLIPACTQGGLPWDTILFT